MNTDSLREAIRRQPFAPFLLRMNDGRVFFIPHPDSILVSRRSVIVVDPATDTEIFLEPVLIASVEFTSPPNQTTTGTATGGNNP